MLQGNTGKVINIQIMVNKHKVAGIRHGGIRQGTRHGGKAKSNIYIQIQDKVGNVNIR